MSIDDREGFFQKDNFTLKKLKEIIRYGIFSLEWTLNNYSRFCFSNWSNIWMNSTNKSTSRFLSVSLIRSFLCWKDERRPLRFTRRQIIWKRFTMTFPWSTAIVEVLMIDGNRHVFSSFTSFCRKATIEIFVPISPLTQDRSSAVFNDQINQSESEIERKTQVFLSLFSLSLLSSLLFSVALRARVFVHSIE